jgi:hypothetical protein
VQSIVFGSCLRAAKCREPIHLKKRVKEYRGRLNFALSFNNESDTLFVNIIQAVELPVRDFIGKLDFQNLNA